MPNPSNNPIPYTGIFHTPASHSELVDWIGQHSGTERALAYTAACMAFNLAHKLVEPMYEAQRTAKAD